MHKLINIRFISVNYFILNKNDSLVIHMKLIPQIEFDEKQRKYFHKAKLISWIKDVQVHLREHGHLLAGTAFVQPNTEQDLITKMDNASEEIKSFDWRVKDFFIVPVEEF